MDGQRPSGRGWRTALVFAVACGLLAESVEVTRIQSGGIVPPGWELRASLFVAYTVIAGGLFAVAALISRRRAVVLAGTVFALVIVLPWLNIALLPRIDSAQSMLGNAAAIVVVCLCAPLLLRLRRTVLAAIALFGLGVNLWPLFATAGPKAVNSAQHAALPFNVMVVLIDTLRADHLGAYGYSRPTSPNFDALAREGVLFERTSSQAAYTKASVASLMTGLFVHNHGVIASGAALGTDHATLAEAMRRRGYHTVAFSSNPWITPEFHFDRGFDDFESGRATLPQLTALYKMLKWFDHGLGAYGPRTNLSGIAFWGASGNLSNSERDRMLTDGAVDWINAQGDEPFFLYMHLIGPHDPYDPPEDYARRFHDPEWDGRVGRAIRPARVATIFEAAAPLDERVRTAMIGQYDAAIAFADAQLGRLIDALRRTGKLDRTLVVVTADHGEEFYEHHNWRHGNQLYNEVVHVPLAFRLPGRLEPTRRDDLAMLVDVFPTVVHLVDGSKGEKGDGRALFAQADGVVPTAFAEDWWLDGGTYRSQMVRQGSLKLQVTRDDARGLQRQELYDLTSDAGEQRNLLENPDAVSEKDEGQLQNLLAHFGDKVSEASAVSVDVDPSTKERLRQLGY
jgi:arylsulfatase A-like enzyme